MTRVLIGVGIAIDVLVALVIYPQQCYEIAAALLLGWVAFLRRTVPLVEINWAGVATGVVALGLLVGAIDRLGRWCFRAAEGAPGKQPRRWRFRWTLSMVLAIVMMFAVGYSTTGLARHLGWIFSSGEPLYEVQVAAKYRVDF